MSTANTFKDLGYVVLKNIVDKGEVTRLYDYTLQNLDLGNPDDGQVPGSPSFYQDREVVALQKKLQSQIETSIQTELLPVFCYNRIYRTGAVLRTHKDSIRAEISATINLGQKGEPWDIWLLDYNENAQKITLSAGDGLIYYGNRLHHWRGKLVNSDFVSQIMFHYVDKNGPNTRAD